MVKKLILSIFEYLPELKLKATAVTPTELLKQALHVLLFLYFTFLSAFSVWKVLNLSEKLHLLLNYVHLQVFTSSVFFFLSDNIYFALEVHIHLIRLTIIIQVIIVIIIMLEFATFVYTYCD